MQVKDIWEEAKESSGICNETILYRTLTRAVELLANEGLFDPLLGTVDFFVEGGYYVALPRDVKTPIRINIDNNPSFTRSRLYEYQPNTDGSNDEEEVGWMWHEKGYSPIQDEKKLPSKLRYQVTSADDEGKTLTVLGTDEDGRQHREILVGALNDPDESQYAYHELKHVVREETTTEAWLLAETAPVGRYYPDETQPEYRVIKLSKTGVAVRMLYRKHTFKLTSQEDIIPLHSAMAVLRAVDAVRMMAKNKYAEAKESLTEAIKFITKEQDTRDEAQSLAVNLEITNTINRNISTNDVLIVADIYDKASDIIGPVGRAKLFDRITDAIELLSNKSKWNSVLGWVDVWKANNCESLYISNRRPGLCKGHGFFVLPRYVKAVEALNWCGEPTIPRNQWFEYHLNGPGTQRRSDCGTWTDFGETCIINFLPLDPDTKRVVPTKIMAIPDNSLDEDHEIRVFGMERLSSGEEVEVWRDGIKGWLMPCKASTYQLPSDAPAFIHIETFRRSRNSTGFIRVLGFPQSHVKIALVGDIGDDSADADDVEEMIKSMNPDEVIAIGDVDYREFENVDTEIGAVQDVDGASIGIYMLRGQGTLKSGDSFRCNGHTFTLGTVGRIASGNPSYIEIIQAGIPDAEDIADLADLEIGMPVYRRTSDEETGTLDKNIGKHFRKYIYPFAGDPDAAPLADGESDATANHFWPVPGNHDWTTLVDRTYFMNDDEAALPEAPNTVLHEDITEVEWLSDDYEVIYLFLAGTGADFSITAFDESLSAIGVSSVTAAGGVVNIAGVANITFSASTNNPATDNIQIKIVRQFAPASLQPYIDYFPDPIKDRYYTKTFGEVQVFFLSSDENEPDGVIVGSTQYLWLVSQVQASTAKWKAVVLHHTPRTSSSVHGPDANFEDWDFDELGINVVFAGHAHSYERWQENGVTYITAGTGNDNLYSFITSGLSAYSKKRIVRHGAVILDASKYALNISFRDKDGNELDSYVIRDTSEREETLLLGYWYPDEMEPRYKIIQVPSCRSAKVRIRYRKRSSKVTSMNDIINLRSRVALEKGMRSLASKDPNESQFLEAQAVQLLTDEMRSSNPIMAGGLQFDPGSCPAVTDNIS